jgi:hypothetical protein
MKRRYDTRFFTACPPSGQESQPDTRETTDGLWVSPENELAGNLAGQIPLSPPTLITLHELLQYPSLQTLERDTENRQWGETYLPRLIPLDKGAAIIEPWDPQYNQEEIEININELKKSVLPVGKSFSRIWYHEGLWRSVGY